MSPACTCPATWLILIVTLSATLAEPTTDTNRMVRPGLTADRNLRQVWVDATATGIGKFDPVEFFLIAEHSGHAYESIAVTPVMPSAIHQALEFIGIPRGLPVDFNQHRYWPKGERVRITFVQGTNAGLRVESLIMDRDTGKPLPASGLVFTGSRTTEITALDPKPEYAADTRSPNAIASNYNEPTTVLDVPWKAVQGEMYRRQTANPDHLFPSNTPLRILLEPDRTDGKHRVVDLTLSLAPAPETAGATLADIRFTIRTTTGTPPVENGSLTGALEYFTRLTREGHDPFVHITMDPALQLGAVKAAAEILASIDTETGIRVEPPEPGHLYIRAFLPDEQHRDRTRRPGQPWELYLVPSNGTVRATLVHLEPQWRDDTVFPDLDLTLAAVPSPTDLNRQMDALGKGIPVILVYAAPDITHGQLMAYLEPIRERCRIIYVYVDEKPDVPTRPRRIPSIEPTTT